MNMKQLLNNVSLLMTRPALAWKFVSRLGDRNSMMHEFLYPMIVLACFTTFLGKMFDSGFSSESIYPAFMRVVEVFFTFFCTYHLTVLLVAKLSVRYVGHYIEKKKAELFTGYSMVVIMLLEICLGLFPSFIIIAWIAQCYTMKIVWDGAAVLLRIDEEQRFGYTMLVSLFIIIIPIILGQIFSLLLVNI